MDIYTDTQKLVQESGQSLSQICAATKLGERWLRKYLNNEFKDVGVRRLQKLRRYLLDNQKEAA